MATVYSAWDETLHVNRAIKILSQNLVSRETVRARFLSEARTMAALNHPNVVTVHDFGQEGNQIYIVMEWMSGGTMADLVEHQGALHPHQAVRSLLPVLKALSAAHGRGIVHRDIKPDNILFSEEGIPKIADFGIAHVADLDRSFTRTGATMGTWAYMAPEQRADAKRVDQRADIYAVGATLYVLVTNREPLDLYATNLHAQLFDGLQESLADVIKKATHYEPDDRYSTAEEMSQALHELAAEFTNPGPLTIEQKAPRQDGATSFPPSAVSQGETADFDMDSPHSSAFTFNPGPLVDAPRDDNPIAEANSSASGAPKLVALAAVLALVFVFGGIWLTTRGEDANVEPPPSGAKSTPEHTASTAPSQPSDSAPTPAEALLELPAEDSSEASSTDNEAQDAADEPLEPDAPASVEPQAEPEPQASPRSETPPAPLEAQTGLLYVNALPPGQVSIDRGALKNTPILGLSLPVGTHTIGLRSPSGADHDRTITITSAEPTRVCWDFNMDAECARR